MRNGAWVVCALLTACGGGVAATDGAMTAGDGGTIQPVSTSSDAGTIDAASGDSATASNVDAASVDAAHADLAHADAAHEDAGGGTTGGPTIVQSAMHESPSAPPPYTATAPFENDSTVTFNKVTKAGDAIWVVATVSDYGGIHTVSVSDTQHNTYTQLDQENDGQPGAQTVVHFWAKNIAGDSKTPDVITVAWGSDNYKGVLAVELADATSLEGHIGVIQDNLAKGTGNVQSGKITVSTTPALLVALSMSTDGGGSDTGGNGCAGASASSGFTSVETLWDWSTATLATVESQAISKAGTANATFNAPCAGPYVTVAAVFH